MKITFGGGAGHVSHTWVRVAACLLGVSQSRRLAAHTLTERAVFKAQQGCCVTSGSLARLLVEDCPPLCGAPSSIPLG